MNDKPTEKPRSRGAELVDKALETIAEKLGELKPTASDLVRLVEAKRKLDEEDEQPAEIKVTWVEPNEQEHGSGK